jgi:DNA polymerase III epsilon subunit-like protein
MHQVNKYHLHRHSRETLRQSNAPMLASRRLNAPLSPEHIVAIDVEYMHLLDGGKEHVRAAQVCMVGNSQVILNTLICMPKELHHFSHVGGVKSSDACASLEEVKEKIKYILGEQNVLVGHNLRKDLAALGIAYYDSRCYDTMDFELFQSSRGKSARTLKHISGQFLGLSIQPAGQPHDITEDCLTVYELFVKVVMPTLLTSEAEFLAYHEWMLSRSMKSLQRESG